MPAGCSARTRLLFFVVQDIYYSNYTELIKKKLTTKFLTTVITEGEKKGKVLRTYNYLHFTVISLQPKNGRAIAECGLFYKWLINTYTWIFENRVGKNMNSFYYLAI